MLRLLPIVFFFLIWPFGCRSVDVTANDLGGTWTMTNASRPNLPVALQKASPRLVLDASGTFAALELPGGILYPPPEGSNRLVSGNGVWKLGSRDGAQELLLEFHKIEDLRKDDKYFNTRRIRPEKAGAATILFYYEGDPDAGRRVDFERH